MNAYQEILDDLAQIIPMEVTPPVSPYTNDMSFKKKFESTLKALERSKRFGSRVLQLINAYYLGKVLEVETESLAQRSYYAQKLSLHYRTVAVRTYYIFEPYGIVQIMRTRTTSLAMIRQLTLREFQNLLGI
jgi:hypothetical protein